MTSKDIVLIEEIGALYHYVSKDYFNINVVKAILHGIEEIINGDVVLDGAMTEAKNDK